MRKSIYSTLLMSIFLLMAGCSCNEQQIDENISLVLLPETTNPDMLNQWAVTRFDLLKLRKNPEIHARIINYIPLGAVVEILQKENKLRTFDTFNNYWYLINYDGEIGWIFGAYLELYNSKEEAFSRAFSITEE